MKKMVLLILLLFPINVIALTYPKLYSKYVIIYDDTDNKVLYEKDSDKITAIASLTKIATTITAIETIPNLDEEVTITSNILNTVNPYLSKAGLKAGDKLSYRDLLYASILPSGADATNSIAILSSGSIDIFVNKMNELAARIGLKNTHFVNVTGLDADGHYSTASDVLKLLSYSLKNSTFKEIFQTKDYTLSNGLKVKSTLYKYNKGINKDISLILGSKTGYTTDAGYAIASLSNTKNHDILIVLINAPSEEKISYHIIDDVDLIDFINNNYDNQTLLSSNEFKITIPVSMSNVDNYEIINNDEIQLFLPNDYDKMLVETKYIGLNNLDFHNQDGDIIGKIETYYNNELIHEENVILNKDIKISYLKVIKKYYYIPLGIIILIGFIVLKGKEVK